MFGRIHSTTSSLMRGLGHIKPGVALARRGEGASNLEEAPVRDSQSMFESKYMFQNEDFGFFHTGGRSR